MNTVHILYLEDNPMDAEMIERSLAKAGILFDATVVSTRADFEAELAKKAYDLILCDNRLPSFDGLAALRLVREKLPEIPFIFVSGSIGEDAAIEALQRGATDYILKDRPGRLASAVRRAIHDSEERKKRQEAEEALRRSEEQVRQIQKLEAIGQLAGGVAHDFNNLLTIINGRSQLMMAKFQPEDPFRKELELIYKTGARAANLTRQLLAFSRKQVLQPRILDLNAVVSDITKMLRRLIGEDIELSLVLQPGLGHVKADPGQVEQVIMNLSVNARDAMPNGGKLTIETSNVDLIKKNAEDPVEMTPGAYVMFSVMDNGVGMDAETQKRAFEPFFTTKGVGKGTGLGLSTVYGIVKQSGGHIGFDSEPGKGTDFKIYLPRVEAALDSSAMKSASTLLSSGRETILVVEDEDEIRWLIQEVLHSFGYTVIQASNGRQALEFASQHTGPIDLLLTDIVMPEMGGRDLAAKLLAMRPTLRVLFMSGYTSDALVKQGIQEQQIAILEKPFAPDVLSHKIRELLNS